MLQQMRSFGARWMAMVLVLGTAILWTGAALAQDGPLQVRRISPSGEDVQPGQEAVIQFDRAMVPLGHMGRKSSEIPVSIKPDPGCQWRWLNTSELACRLAKQVRFAPATEYTVTVGTALKALDGSHLDEPDVEAFTTWRPKVDRSEFQEWRGPTTPVFMVRLNMPVTAAQLARHIGFADGNGDWVAAKVEPFTKDRDGPMFLPMPGLPGAVIAIDNPKPNTPLDAHAAANAGRRVWQVVPVRPLHAATGYKLHVKPGMRSPLGPLPGDQDEDVDGMTTYGAFTFRGVACNDNIKVLVGEASQSRCEPSSVSLLFSVPVPRATLAAIQWKPLPLPKDKLAKMWRDYPQWFVRDRDYAYDADSDDTYPLTFVFNPMSAWELTVPAGVKDSFGRKLPKPITLDFLTGHRSPFLDPPPGEAVLETGQKTIVPLRFTNLDDFTFDWQRLWPNDLFPGIDAHANAKPKVVHEGRPYAPWRGTTPGPFSETHPLDHDSRDNADSGSIDLLQRPDLAAPADTIVKGNLGIRDLLDGKPGVVWGTLDWSPNGPYRPYSFMGEVTPWQVLAKVGHYGTLVWINRWDSGKPVAGAKVKFLLGHDRNLDPLEAIGKTVTTDDQGLAQLQGTATLPESWFNRWNSLTNFYLGTARNDELALLPLDGTFQRSVGDASNYVLYSDIAMPNGHLRAWAVTEQGIYKPGSDVKYAAFVRAEGKTTLAPPPALEYTLTITDPEGNQVLKREHLKLSAFGGIDGSLHIAKTAPMGWYDITIAWPMGGGSTASRDAGRFMVTDFVPATFKVRTQVLGTHFEPGDKVEVRVDATLHAGGPYTDAKVKFTTQLVPKMFSPDTPVAAQFSFYNYSETMPNAQTLAVSDGQLDHAGYAHTEVTLPAKSDIVYGEVQVEGSVESARSTWVANDASVPFSARDRFIGLHIDNWMQSAAKPFAVKYLVVDPAGNPAAGSKLELQLQRRVITRVRVKNGAGNFSEEEHSSWLTVDHCSAVSTAAPGSCELTPPQAGDYQVIATVTDSKGRTQSSMLGTWVTGEGDVVWSTAGKGVTLVPDKSSYHVGDVAHVLVQNPYPGAHALVTIERYGVLWKKVVTLKGSAPVIDVPIGPECFPGAYLSVAIFSPRVSPPADPDLGRPEVALG
ncbi:MAG TPA: MG2 domain-containing protein, partial [Rhodanobacteraceae bacterium]|nr:MG2 domain-containing protein [Rhodanobacteraceae bacterium]